MDGPRLVRRDETNAVSDLLCRVFGMDKVYDRAEFTRDLTRPIHLRSSVIIAEDGKPVSFIFTGVDGVSTLGCRTKAASLGGVCTDADHRNRGYAGMILERSMERATAAGARVLYVSGDRSLYRRNHCVHAGDILETGITRDSLPASRSDLTLRRFTIDEWPSISPLCEAEPTRFIRSADFFSQCCCWWDVTRPDLWLISSGGTPLAYVALTPHWRSEGRPIRTAFEIAGSRAALFDALPALLEAAGLEEITLRFQRQDWELAHLVASRGLRAKPTPIGGTLRILNLPGLMRDLRPYLTGRLSRQDLRKLSFDQQGEMCILAFGDQRAEIGLSQAAPLVLGGHDRPQIDGDLGRALSAIFPVPFPVPGFNFV